MKPSYSPTMVRPGRGRIAPLVGAALLLASGVLPSGAPAADPDCPHAPLPAGAVFSSLDAVPPANFSPEVGDIVHAMTFSGYDRTLRALSGEDSVEVGGARTLFRTRYTLCPEGRRAVEYARERLAAMGYTVDSTAYSIGGGTRVDLVARIQGVKTPNRVVVLGAHLDSISEKSWTLAPGAEDNAGGSAGVLTAAAALAGRRFDSTVELVLFTGEEQFLRGSSAYVKALQAAGAEVRGAVIFDMISFWKDRYGVLIDGNEASAPLMQLVGEAVDAYTGLSREFSNASLFSDHQAFEDFGVPAVLLIDRDYEAYPAYHRSTDVYANTDPRMGIEVARAAAAAVAQLAGPAPGGQQNPGRTGEGTALRLGPNPARAYVDIATDVPHPVRIYDLSGRLVRRLSPAPSGLRWNLTDGSGQRVPPGVYFLRNGGASERLVVLP